AQRTSEEVLSTADVTSARFHKPASSLSGDAICKNDTRYHGGPPEMRSPASTDLRSLVQICCLLQPRRRPRVASICRQRLEVRAHKLQPSSADRMRLGAPGQGVGVERMPCCNGVKPTAYQRSSSPMLWGKLAPRHRHQCFEQPTP